MKRIILFLILIVIGINNELKAQTFNRVVDTLFYISASYTSSSNPLLVGSFIIPNGMVWKIESTSLLKNNQITNASALIDRHIVYQKISRNANSGVNIDGVSDFVSAHPLPLWLSSGSHSVYYTGGTQSSSQLYQISISAIEFSTN